MKSDPSSGLPSHGWVHRTVGASKWLAGQALTAAAVESLRRDVLWMAEPWRKASAVPGMLYDAAAVSLATILQDSRPAVVVEIGSYLGRSSVYLAECLRVLSVHGARVHAVDPHTGDRQQLDLLGSNGRVFASQVALFHDHLRLAGVSEYVEPHVMASEEAAQRWDGSPIDMLYVDGWHSYEAVRIDAMGWMPWLATNGVVVFDDYSRYLGVQQAVDSLAREGVCNLWGNAFGQAVGGSSGSEPSPAIEKLIRRANAGPLRRVYRPRGS